MKVLIASVFLGAAALAGCSSGSGDKFDPPGDGSVALGLECNGNYPAKRADYYTGIEVGWYEAAQICLDCPNWPARNDADTCAQRVHEKFQPKSTQRKEDQV